MSSACAIFNHKTSVWTPASWDKMMNDEGKTGSEEAKKRGRVVFRGFVVIPVIRGRVLCF